MRGTGTTLLKILLLVSIVWRVFVININIMIFINFMIININIIIIMIFMIFVIFMIIVITSMRMMEELRVPLVGGALLCGG